MKKLHTFGSSSLHLAVAFLSLGQHNSRYYFYLFGPNAHHSNNTPTYVYLICIYKIKKNIKIKKKKKVLTKKS